MYNCLVPTGPVGSSTGHWALAKIYGYGLFSNVVEDYIKHIIKKISLGFPNDYY